MPTVECNLWRRILPHYQINISINPFTGFLNLVLARSWDPICKIEVDIAVEI